MHYPYIIAEIGSNWRDLNDCFTQIKKAKECGADAVKFQLFTFEELYGVQGQLKYELLRDWIEPLSVYSKKVGIDFMCSAFSEDGFEFVDPYVNIHKIASPEACCDNIREKVFSLSNQIFMSNGCLTIDEQIEIIDGPHWGADDVLMECVSQYPAHSFDYDFSHVVNLSNDYSFLWGLSDHTRGLFTAIVARQLGACVFEKHVDFVGIPQTPDSCVSVDPQEFKDYVKEIKAIKDTYDKDKRKAKEKYGRTISGYRPLP